MMPSFVYQVSSIITIFILSLPQANSLDLASRNVAQSPIDPVGNLEGSNVPVLEFGTSSNADVSGANLDANSVGIAQVVRARSDARSCSKGKRRRRRDESSCTSQGMEMPPSSQQNKPKNSDEQPRKEDFGVGEQQNTFKDMPAPAPESESPCPEEHFPICVAPNLLVNPSAPGIFNAIPWVGYNIPQTIDVSEYSRFCACVDLSCRLLRILRRLSAFANLSTNRFKNLIGLTWDPCTTIKGEELFMCCKQVGLRVRALLPFTHSTT